MRPRRPRRWLQRLVRAAAAIVAVLASAALVAGLAFRSWSRAQLDAVVALAITQRTPVLAPLVRLATDGPRVDETVVAGMPTTLARPGEGRGPWPAIVFVNGATRRGRFHPKVQRLARGLARAGFLVAVPDLPGLRFGEITAKTMAATVRVAQAVGGEAPWVDLRKVIRLATTGYYGGMRYGTDPYVRLAIARSLAAELPRASDRGRLLSLLEGVADDDPSPLTPLRGRLRLGPGGHALVSLLVNTDPSRFARLYARLPPTLRRGVRLLSPLLRAGR